MFLIPPPKVHGLPIAIENVDTIEYLPASSTVVFNKEAYNKALHNYLSHPIEFAIKPPLDSAFTTTMANTDII